MPKLDTEKYKNLILYLASKLGGEIRGKKKLAKLLYFVDFDFFEKNQKYITKEVYKALPMGPVPIHLENMIEELVHEERIKTDSVEERAGYLPTVTYTSLSKPKESIFSKEEKEIIDRVISKYGQLNGKQLEDITHAEAPYIGTKPNDEIDYELSFYRGTDFSSNA